MKKIGINYKIIVWTLIYTLAYVMINVWIYDLKDTFKLDLDHFTELSGEGLVLLFAFIGILVVAIGYSKRIPVKYLLIGVSLFYISQLQDFMDEFFHQGRFFNAVEIMVFPISIIFIGIGIIVGQKFQRRLMDNNIALTEQYKLMSITDSQTGLYNIRYFYETVPGILDVAKKTQVPLSLMILDIDDFKAVNDTYGHLEGDRLIIYLGGLIRHEFGLEYQCYRYGGEEFVVVMEGEDLSACESLADKIRMKFSEKVFAVDQYSYSKTISIGIAQYTVGDNLSSLLGKADDAMYHAKTTGKNKICKNRSHEI